MDKERDEASLMTALSSRPYQDAADYESMRALVRQCCANDPRAYATIGELGCWRSDEPDPDHPRIQLWFRNAHLIGFGWPANTQIEMLVDSRYPEVLEDILAWSEARPADAVLPEGVVRSCAT